MTKPADIEQKHWDAAERLESNLPSHRTGKIGDIPNLVIVEDIARSIQSAVNEEREACAKLPDVHLSGLVKEHGSYDPTTGQTEFPEWVESELEWLETWAKAIRQRGAKP